MFETILLKPQQLKLLKALVEVDQVSKGQEPFIALGDDIMQIEHSGWRSTDGVYRGDIEALSDERFLRLSHGKHGLMRFDVTQRAVEYVLGLTRFGGQQPKPA